MPDRRDKINIQERAEEDYLASIAGSLHAEQLYEEYHQEDDIPLTPVERALLPDSPPFPSKKRFSYLKKHPIFAAAILVLVVALLMGFTYSVVRMFTIRENEQQRDFMSVRELPDGWEYYFETPKGYTLDYIGMNNTISTVIFTNIEGNSILLTMAPLDYTASVDNEVLEHETLRMNNGTEAYLTQKEETYKLVWYIPGNICVIQGDASKDLIITLANSVEKV